MAHSFGLLPKAEDCISGVFGAVVGEMLAEQIGKSDISDEAVLMISQLGVVALAQAGDLDVAAANETASNAVQNNYLSSRQQKKLAEELKACNGGFVCAAQVAGKYGLISTGQDTMLAGGIVAGLGEGVYDEAKGLVEVLSNPAEAVEGLKALLNDPSIIGEVAEAELNEVKSLLVDFETNYELAGADGAFNAGRNLGNIAGKAIALIGGTATGVGGVALGTSKAVAKVVGKLQTNKMLKSGLVLDRNGLTKAGRALQKHGDRNNSAFPKATGTSVNENKQGQKILEEILNSNNQTKGINKKTGRLEIVDRNTGRGVSYNTDGTFRGFLEP